ncbi:methionine ABC transporter ATP-binding protein [Paenibacillus sp. JDR-2]|uniref:methionine ABC transporter ATP-binding protein n=1 Tax=Paenibacillus sp. (strain JDR-2) TaxID=324057 RepID=UPI0001665731|nr:ATP-binding cassette domain-containing protein [Paenibacillus sp. JDR-2]ACS98781.1 ABC transporter related [Paenibacillus sp. JDR-2]
MITFREVSKRYKAGRQWVEAVKPTSLHIEKGQIQGMIGFSGAGKSTLLRMANLLETPTSGEVYIDGQELTRLSAGELREARRSIGMIFQHYNLLSNETCAANVEFVLKAAKLPSRERKRRVEECLEIVGLADKARQYPAQLSGGQKQRVAIARALANNPKVLLCDEPTSALDPVTTLSILEFLEKINREFQVTIMLVTHEIQVAKRLCSRIAVMENGRITEQLDMMNLSGVKPVTPLGQILFDTAEGSSSSVWQRGEGYRG